jgi:cytochrome c oxidase cbb3-type subunit 4
MYKNVLQSIDNIEIWPVISFVIFFSFFLGLLIWVFTADQKYIQKMKSLPIEDKNNQNETSQSTADAI